MISFFTWRANHLQPWHRWLSALGKESPTNWLSVLQWNQWPLCICQFGSRVEKTSPSVEHLCQCQCRGPSEWGSHSPMRKTERQRVRFTDLTNEGIFYFFIFVTVTLKNAPIMYVRTRLKWLGTVKMTIII